MTTVQDSVVHVVCGHAEQSRGQPHLAKDLRAGRVTVMWSEWCMKGVSNGTTSPSDQVCNSDHNHHSTSVLTYCYNKIHAPTQQGARQQQWTYWLCCEQKLTKEHSVK